MYKDDILCKLKTQDRLALETVNNLLSDGQIIVLYGEDFEGKTALTDIVRAKADLILDSANLDMNQIKNGKIIFINDADGIVDYDALTAVSNTNTNTIVVCTTATPKPPSSHTLLAFEIKLPSTDTKFKLTKEMCHKYGYEHTPHVVNDIVATVGTVSELRSEIFNRLAKREVSYKEKRICHDFDAPYMRQTEFILYHLLGLILVAILLSLLPTSQIIFGRNHGFLETALITQTLMIAFLLLIEHGRAQSIFGVILNTAVSVATGLISFIFMHLI